MRNIPTFIFASSLLGLAGLLGKLLSSRVSLLSGCQMFGPPLLRSSGLLSVVGGDTLGATPL